MSMQMKLCFVLVVATFGATCGQAIAQTAKIPAQESVFPYSLPPNPKAGDTATICTGDPLPTGWVYIDQKYVPGWESPHCYDPGYPVNNVEVIEYYVGFPPGKMLTVCTGAREPSGWIAHDSYHDAGRCKFYSANNVEVFEKYAGLPVGSELTYCTLYDRVPSGWSVVSQSYAPNNCGEPNYIVNNVTLIKRVQ